MVGTRRPPYVLHDSGSIAARVAELGAAIAEDHPAGDLVLVSVLKGGAVFLADLIRAIPRSLSVDFMAISPFGSDGDAGGRVRIVKDLDEPIDGRAVVVVEDIVDSGLTLAYLRSILLARHPVSVEVCTLLDRAVRRIAPLDIRYVGFDCPDLFVVGYGLDLDQHHRNIPHVVAVEDVAAAQADPTCLDRFLPGVPVPLAAHDVPE